MAVTEKLYLGCATHQEFKRWSDTVVKGVPLRKRTKFKAHLGWPQYMNEGSWSFDDSAGTISVLYHWGVLSPLSIKRAG